MTSKYLQCDACKTTKLDRKPADHPSGRDGAFHSKGEIRSYATSIGWLCFEGVGYNGGRDYCPDCARSRNFTGVAR